MIRSHGNLRIQRGAEHLHRLGARATCEFLIAFAERHDLTPELLHALNQWRSLDVEIMRAVVQHHCGGRQFPPALAVVEGGRHG